MSPTQAVPGGQETALMKPVKAFLFLQLFPGRASGAMMTPTSVSGAGGWHSTPRPAGGLLQRGNDCALLGGAA